MSEQTIPYGCCDECGFTTVGCTCEENDGRPREMPPAPAVAWTTEPPTEQGAYWHWNGDSDYGPVHLNVLWSGFSGKCFVSIGQYGISQAIDCDKYGGWWKPLPDPELPTREALDAARAALTPKGKA